MLLCGGKVRSTCVPGCVGVILYVNVLVSKHGA